MLVQMTVSGEDIITQCADGFLSERKDTCR
jgi:hypothetical protein